MKLTTEKYKCAKCDKLKQLVIVQGSAYLCEQCYKKKLKNSREKRAEIKELNEIANKIIYGLFGGKAE